MIIGIQLQKPIKNLLCYTFYFILIAYYLYKNIHGEKSFTGTLQIYFLILSGGKILVVKFQWLHKPSSWQNMQKCGIPLFQESSRLLYFEKTEKIDPILKELCLFKVFKPAIQGIPPHTLFKDLFLRQKLHMKPSKIFKTNP